MIVTATQPDDGSVWQLDIVSLCLEARLSRVQAQDGAPTAGIEGQDAKRRMPYFRAWQFFLSRCKGGCC